MCSRMTVVIIWWANQGSSHIFSSLYVQRVVTSFDTHWYYAFDVWVIQIVNECVIHLYILSTVKGLIQRMFLLYQHIEINWPFCIDECNTSYLWCRDIIIQYLTMKNLINRYVGFYWLLTLHEWWASSLIGNILM